MVSRIVVSISAFCILLLAHEINSQKKEWLYQYDVSSDASLITQVSDDDYLISGNSNPGKMFSGFFDGAGNHLKTLLFDDMLDKYIVFQSKWKKDTILLLNSDGKIVSINVMDYSTNILGDIFENQAYFGPNIRRTFLTGDTLSVLISHYKNKKMIFDYIYYNLSNKFIQSIHKNQGYPLEGIRGYYPDRSMAVIRQNDDSLWFEKYDRLYNLKYSLRIDTLFDWIDKVLIHSQNETYLLGNSNSGFKSTLLAIDPDGKVKWAKTFEPVFVDSLYSSFKYFYDIIESQDEHLILTGSQGYAIIGPISNSTIAKLDKNGNCIWEEQTYLHREGSASYQVVENSKGDYVAVGTLGISDYQVPNRAYIIKYKELSNQFNNSFKEETVKVFPNPTPGNIHILFNEFPEAAYMEIYDLRGIRLVNNQIKCAYLEMNLDLQSNAIYLMRIFSNSKCIYSKLLYIG